MLNKKTPDEALSLTFAESRLAVLLAYVTVIPSHVRGLPLAQVENEMGLAQAARAEPACRKNPALLIKAVQQKNFEKSVLRPSGASHIPMQLFTQLFYYTRDRI
jgi:hypothetical protein